MRYRCSCLVMYVHDFIVCLHARWFRNGFLLLLVILTRNDVKHRLNMHGVIWGKRHRKEYYVTRFSSDLFYVSYKPGVCAIQTQGS